MTTVYLYGHLGRRFGHRWRLDVQTPAEAVRAIIANRPDFHAHLIQHSTPGYQVVVGTDILTKEEALRYPAGQQAIKIVPVVAGAAQGKDPVIGVIVGVVLVAVAVAAFMAPVALTGVALTTANSALTAAGSVVLSVGFMGAGMVIGGIATLLAGNPNAPGPSERPENKPSFIFNGAVNTTAQGHPVPIGYGRMRVGSAVISAGIAAEDVAL